MWIEDVWIRLREKTDSFFFEIHKRRNTVLAEKIKVQVDEYLDRLGVTYKSLVDADPFMADGPYVYVRVFVKEEGKHNYVEFHKLWDLICKAGYDGFSVDETVEVYIMCHYMEEYSSEMKRR